MNKKEKIPVPLSDMEDVKQLERVVRTIAKAHFIDDYNHNEDLFSVLALKDDGFTLVQIHYFGKFNMTLTFPKGTMASFCERLEQLVDGFTKTRLRRRRFGGIDVLQAHENFLETAKDYIRLYL